MKNITDFINEALMVEGELVDIKNKITQAEDAVVEAEKEDNKSEESIKSEKDFREYAENKFKEAFGDELDEDKMNETVDGLLKDNKDLVDAGEWGELVGMLNKSFAK